MNRWHSRTRDCRARTRRRAGTSAGGPRSAPLLANVNDATGGRERIVLYTALRQDGSLFYMIGVSPDQEFNSYQQVFNKIAGSVQFAR